MMPQTNPQCSSMDQPEHGLLPPSRSQEGCTTEVVVEGRMKADPGQRNGGTASSSPESGSQNGDGKRGGKSRRRRKHSANPESSPATAERKGRVEGKLSQGDSHPLDSSSVLLGLRSECASVWFDRSVYEQAESLYQSWLTRSVNGATRPNGSHHLAELHFVEESRQLMTPNSLVLPNRPTVPATPDEGYLSLAPTPATPTAQVTTPPPPRQPVNGLPRIPMELLRDVWLEKPLYDRAEAAFYQNLYGNNLGTTNSRISCSSSPSTSRSSSDHPQSLVEVEEEEEEEEVVSQTKAEVFHALHPIKEEEEPADVTDEERLSVEGVSFFLHPDSERVWLAKGRYEAAESHFYGQEQAAAAAEGAQGKDTEASSVTCTGPLRDNTMSAVDCLAQEKIWFDKPRYDDAERHFYEGMNGPSRPAQEMGANSILQDIARARENIQKSLAGLKSSLLPSRGNGQPPLNRHPQLSTGSGAGDQGELITRIRGLELENNSLHQVVEDLRSALSRLECRVADLEKSPVTAGAPAPCTNGTAIQQQKTSAQVEEEDDDDDDIDLFGSDEEEDVEAERLKEQRVKEYAERKAKKPTLIAKSSILLDVKPWDDETDMAKLEECVRTVQADGLLWGSSKLVPVGYGIKKLQIQCVVEDDKVGTDLLEEEITKFEDYVQSVDVAAFNKI